MGKKKKQNQKGTAGGGGIRQIGVSKKFQPETLTKRLEQRKAVNQRGHKRQNGFEQIKCLSDLVASAEQRQSAFEREEAASAEKDR